MKAPGLEAGCLQPGSVSRTIGIDDQRLLLRHVRVVDDRHRVRPHAATRKQQLAASRQGIDVHARQRALGRLLAGARVAVMAWHAARGRTGLAVGGNSRSAPRPWQRWTPARAAQASATSAAHTPVLAAAPLSRMLLLTVAPGEFTFATAPEAPAFTLQTVLLRTMALASGTSPPWNCPPPTVRPVWAVGWVLMTTLPSTTMPGADCATKALLPPLISLLLRTTKLRNHSAVA